MALFSKKAANAPSAPPADDNADVAGGPATLTADDPFGGEDFGVAPDVAPDGSANGKAKKVKAVREPRAPKNKVVKNGVAVGLNIGNQFIKAVEVTSKGGELTVTGMGIVPTPPESYSNGNVLSVSALANAIKDLWRTSGIKSRVAITSVAGTGALVVRVIEVPKMSDGELRDNMKVDADRYIPFPPSEVVMDFKALRELPSDPDAPNMEVLLAAAQREVIDLHVSVVQRAKLSPRAIDVEPIAAVRALQLERQGASDFADYNEVTAIVNIGATGAEISILRGDVLVFTRAVPNGGNSVTQAIANGLGLPFSDAERLKIASADALAPAGYDASANDFGFGGGDDFDFGAPPAAGVAEDFGAAPSAASSDDPFDLDFFNSGAAQTEPGAGHAQKEDDTPASSSPFDFDFDAPATPVTPPAASSPPAAASSSPFDFSFSADPTAPDASVSPASVRATNVPATPATPASAFAFGFDDADTTEAAATSDKGTKPLSDVTGAPTSAPPTSFEDDFAAPAASFEAETASSAASASAPSAFDFDNLDLPAVQAGAAPITSATSTPISTTPPVTETDPFSLDVPPAQPVVTPAATTADIAAPVAAATDAGQFDLDSIFGTPAATVPAASTVAATAPIVTTSAATAPLGALDATVVSSSPADASVAATPVAAAPVTAAVPAAADDNFDLSGIDTGFDTGFDDPATGLQTPADDFAAFGAGLAPSSGSTDAATLYSLIYSPLEELSNEVRRSLEFHLGRYPDATISRLVLMGGGARLRNLDVFLTQMIGVPTAVANPFTHLKVRASKSSPEFATENGPICAIALGLALRDFVD